MNKWFPALSIAVGLGAAATAIAQTTEPGVAIIDSGTNAGGLNIAGGLNLVGDPNDLSDQSDNGHGTASSLLVNDYAPGIPIYPYKVFTGSADSNTQGTTDAGIIAAVNQAGVKVIALVNGSDGVSSVIGPASAANKLVTITAGNNNGGQPNAGAIAASATPGVVIASGTDGAGNPLGGTSICGVTMARCVRARGVSSVVNYSGSSFAAAAMAGIAAQVWRTAPWLTNEDMAQVLFATALDFGDPGIDPIFGQGYIADAAQVINSPAGPTSIPGGGSDGGGGGGGGGAAIALVAVGAAVAVGGVALSKKNKEKLEKTLVLDPFGRPFIVDATELIYTRNPSRFSVSDYLENLDEMYNEVSIKLGDDHALRMSYLTFNDDRFDVGRHFAMENDLAYAKRDLDWSASLRSTHVHGLTYQMDINTDPAMNFGALRSTSKRTQEPVVFLSGQNFSTPYLGFTNRANSASMGFADRSGWQVKFAVVNSEDEFEYGPKSVAEVIEGSYEFSDRGKLTAQFGRLEEAGSMFGGTTGGIFSVDNAETYALSVSGVLHLTDRISVIGNYGIGYTSITDHKRSLLNDFSSVRTNWFGMGLIGHNLVQDRDQWGVSFSQPLRVMDGEVDMRVPYARDIPGNIYSNEDRIGLAPSGREYVVETFYRFRLNRRASLGAHFMYQHEPEHNDDAGDEMTLLTTLRYGF